MALDGGWGTGKTAFFAICTAWLRSEYEIPVVEFNAWTQGHTQIPLVDLVSALSAHNKHDAGRLKKSVASVGWHLAKFSTRGLIDRDMTAEATVSEDAWDDAENKTADFKKKLQDWAEARGPRGLVVCVDELDRCRPEYALSLLEVIRHLFDVPGVVVLLAINRSELSHSVKSIFGGDFSADRYLRRIVDRTVQLPVPRAFAQAGVPGWSAEGFGTRQALQRPDRCRIATDAAHGGEPARKPAGYAAGCGARRDGGRVHAGSRPASRRCVCAVAGPR